MQPSTNETIINTQKLDKYDAYLSLKKFKLKSKPLGWYQALLVDKKSGMVNYLSQGDTGEDAIGRLLSSLKRDVIGLKEVIEDIEKVKINDD